jgi:protein YIPF6
MIVKLILVGVGFVWSTRASVVFMIQVIKEERRTLAVYPVFFFYTFIGWIILLQ